MTIGPDHPDHPGYQGPREQPGPGPEWPQYGSQPGQQPGYGYPAPYAPPVLAPQHPKATTALTLGIIGLAGTFTCGVPIVVGPFAWAVGAKAKREIAASGGAYRGESEATIGMVLGIVTTALLAFALLGLALFVGLVVLSEA